MPYFILILVLVIVILPLGIAKLLLDYRAKQDTRGGEITLTVAELEQLIRRYVEEATEPLRDRIRVLEDTLQEDHSRPGRDISPSEQPLLDDPSLEDDNLRVDDNADGNSKGGVA